MTSDGIFSRVGSDEADYLSIKMVQCMLLCGILGRNKIAVKLALKAGEGQDIRVRTRGRFFGGC